MTLDVRAVVQEDVDVRAHMDVREVAREVARVVAKAVAGAHAH